MPLYTESMTTNGNPMYRLSGEFRDSNQLELPELYVSKERIRECWDKFAAVMQKEIDKSSNTTTLHSVDAWGGNEGNFALFQILGGIGAPRNNALHLLNRVVIEDGETLQHVIGSALARFFKLGHPDGFTRAEMDPFVVSICPHIVAAWDESKDDLTTRNLALWSGGIMKYWCPNMEFSPSRREMNTLVLEETHIEETKKAILFDLKDSGDMVSRADVTRETITDTTQVEVASRE